MSYEATFDENRRAVGMLNPMRDKNEGTYRGKKGRHGMKIVQKIAEDKTTYIRVERESKSDETKRKCVVTGQATGCT